MRSSYIKLLVLSGMFITQSGYALTPACLKMQFLANAKPGSGGTTNNTRVGLLKAAHNDGANYTAAPQVYAAKGGTQNSLSPENYDQLFLPNSNGAFTGPTATYKDCTIEKNPTNGVVTSVTFRVDGTFYQGTAASGVPATLAVTATELIPGNRMGMPSGAQFKYFKKLSFQVVSADGTETTLAGTAELSSPTSGGTSNGGGSIWFNPPVNWPR